MEREDLVKFLKKYGIGIGLGLVGLGMIGVGLWGYVKPSEMEVEVLRQAQDTQAKGDRLPACAGREANSFIVVDVSGAVEKPGVYELKEGARVAEALTAAGGLAEMADRIWVQQHLNLAQKVADGMKIYVPFKGEQDSGLPAQAGFKVQGNGGKVLGARVVNVNTASLEELDGLWGIGESRAKAIIEHRPYGSLDELVTKAGIPQSVLDKNEGKIGL